MEYADASSRGRSLATTSDVHERIVAVADPTFDSDAVWPEAAMLDSISGTHPTVAAHGTADFVVVFHNADAVDGGEFAISSGLALGPEADDLRALLSGYLVDDLAVAPGRGDSAWFTWRGAGAAYGSDSMTVPVAYLLAVE